MYPLLKTNHDLGEFGVVYKGQVIKNLGQTVTETVAIKTLKGNKASIAILTIQPDLISLNNIIFTSGFYDGTTVRDMLRECSKMSKFDHPNVLTLQGVCLDGGPAPYIIMPFMANGNLLTYLKNNRKNLVVTSKSEDDQDVSSAAQLDQLCNLNEELLIHVHLINVCLILHTLACMVLALCGRTLFKSPDVT